MDAVHWHPVVVSAVPFCGGRGCPPFLRLKRLNLCSVFFCFFLSSQFHRHFQPNVEANLAASPYHAILGQGGGKILMPRRTVCFDYEFPFSGTRHGIERTTPIEISNLYTHTNALFHYLNEGVNMCLTNSYLHGHHWIMQHGDDERMMALLHDVCCWTTGPAARQCVFRWHRAFDSSNAVLIRLNIPAGLYVMKGECFQKEYSHEVLLLLLHFWK